MAIPDVDTSASGEMPAFLRSGGEMARRIAAYDWSRHPLGPLERWPQSLRTAVSLMLNSRHPMWIGWGREMSFLYNDAYLHVLGLAKHPWALGRPAEEVWSEIWDVCGPLADKVFRYGEASFVDDVRLFMSRGEFLEETFYSFSYSPIRDESGEVAGLFCPSNDVTAKVVGARRLGTLSELAADALVQKTAPAACATAAMILAKNPDDVPFALLYLAQDDACVLQQSVGIEEPGQTTWPVDDVVRTGNAQRISLRNLVLPPYGAADRPVLEALVLPMAGGTHVRPQGAIVVGVNPTCELDDAYRTFFELVASNIGTAIQNALSAEEQKKRADMLAEIDRAKTAFFSNVSHEFRTPLTLMLGPLDELSHVGEERYRSLAAAAKRNSLRLLKLVNTLLEFSRLEAGRNDAAFVETDLASLTRDVASSFRSAIESAGLRLSVDVDLQEAVFVDRSMWERIMLNLLSNALKFTLEGEISVTLRRDGECAELAVRDTGVGVPEEELPHLFERFHRVRGTKARSHEGSGIGLALVHDLAELHGGSVSATSRPGEGTTFVVRIPLGKTHLDPAKIVAPDIALPYTSAVQQYLAEVDATVSRAGVDLNATPSSGTRERVLLADDNADLREYVQRILSSRYDVVAVTNGAEALHEARNEHFDLVVSDVMMPEMDGLELLSAIRADDKLATIPFILLSARAGEESALEGLAHGADDYIVKPFSSEELLVRVYAQINAAAIRERANRDLRASEERFRTLASSMPHIVLEASPDGAITFLSEEYTKYTGLPAESGYQAGWADVVHPDDVEIAKEKWARALKNGEPFSNEFRARRSDGAYRWHVARILPQRDENGNIVRWTGTVNDVHDIRRAVQERELLAEAAGILAQSLDVDTTLRSIAEIAVPRLGDWCQIDLRTPEGRIKTVAIVHRDPQKNQLAQEFVGRVHLNPDGDAGSPYVIRTGQSQVIAEVPPELAADAVGDPEEFRMYSELGLASVAAVPLVAEGETLGMLAVLSAGERRYSEDDLPLLEELGRRAGLALQRSRIFEREHRVAASFQEASLPLGLPHVAGLSFDAVYDPGSAEAQIGGDWYDAVRLIDGRVVVSIGDVAGSGLNAAVTMGNIRQIIRGIAQVHADPALILDAADRALRLEYPDKFVTAFVGVIDSIAKTFTYASAGHPPAMLRQANGDVEALSDFGLPLGLRVGSARTVSASIALTEGSCLVLYTDGLTEAARDPESGERRLKELLREDNVCTCERPAKVIVGRMLEGCAASDDVAVLTVQLTSTGVAGEDDFQRWIFDSADAVAAMAARREFAEAFAARGASIEDTCSAEIVFGELVGNTVRYAPGDVEVIADWSGAQPVLHVRDKGPGFRHISMLPPDLLSESGRGLFIVSSLTDDFRVSKNTEGGSHARAVLRRHSRGLIPTDQSGLSGSLLYALTGSVSDVMSA